MATLSYDIDHLGEAADLLISEGKDTNVWLFYGEMGMGKTTLINEICSKIGVTEPTSSPTFSIINEYRKGDGTPVYHFDFYRFNSPEELWETGANEYFASGHLCLVEWPEKIAPYLPKEYFEICVTLGEHFMRTITCKHVQQTKIGD